MVSHKSLAYPTANLSSMVLAVASIMKSLIGWRWEGGKTSSLWPIFKQLRSAPNNFGFIVLISSTASRSNDKSWRKGIRVALARYLQCTYIVHICIIGCPSFYIHPWCNVNCYKGCQCVNMFACTRYIVCVHVPFFLLG